MRNNKRKINQKIDKQKDDDEDDDEQLFCPNRAELSENPNNRMSTPEMIITDNAEDDKDEEIVFEEIDELEGEKEEKEEKKVLKWKKEENGCHVSFDKLNEFYSDQKC